MTVHGRLGLGMAVLTFFGALLSGASAVADTATLELPSQQFSEPVFDSLEAAFEVYEEVRSELAADRLQEVPTAALRLSGALRLALKERSGLAGETPGVIEQAALAAEALGEAEALAAARIAFGEVSRYLLALAGSDPRLVEGLHLFACPMAEKFGRWIQPMEEMENPYMGPAMLKCGWAAEWSDPVPAAEDVRRSAVEAKRQIEPSGPQPEFKPGIPGLEMVDVRDHKFLWREIDELHIWERGDRISVAEFRSKAIEKTAHFLELEGSAAEAFVATANQAVAEVRESFARERHAEGHLSSDLAAAVARLESALGEAPRHQLFAPESKKWLLKLAFGPREAKEAREAQSARLGAQATGSDAP